jgi:hypothetical protein
VKKVSLFRNGILPLGLPLRQRHTNEYSHRGRLHRNQAARPQCRPV